MIQDDDRQLHDKYAGDIKDFYKKREVEIEKEVMYDATKEYIKDLNHNFNYSRGTFGWGCPYCGELECICCTVYGLK